MEKTKVSLTKNGKRLLSPRTHYNDILTDIIDLKLKQCEYSVDQLGILIRESISNLGIPSAIELHREARQLDGLRIESKWFKILLDLLAHAGNFRCCFQRSYFPP